MQRLGIVLVDKSAERLKSQILDASKHGHLIPLMLIETSVEQAGQAMSSMDAVVIEYGQSKSVKLERYLNQQKIDEIHCVTVRHADLDDAQLAPTKTIESAVAGWLRSESNKSQTVLTLGVVIGLPATSHLHDGMFWSEWDYNVCVAAQDWAGEPGFVSAQIGSPENQDSLFIVSMLLIGGWMWLDSALAQNVKNDGFISESRARAARAVVRIVDAGDLAVRLASEALELSNAWPIPEETQSHPDTRALMDELELSITTHPDVNFKYSEPTSVLPPTSTSLNPWAVVRMFFREMGEEIRRAPHRWLRRKLDAARRWIEDIIQDQTYGKGSEVLARFGNVQRPEDVTSNASLNLAQLSTVPGLNVISTQPNPNTWKILFRGVLGAIDGARVNDKGLANTTKSSMIFVTRNREDVAALDAVGANGVVLRTPAPDGETLRIREYDVLAMSRIRHLAAEKDEWVEALTKIDEIESHRSHTLLWRIAVRLGSALDASQNALKASVDEASNIKNEFEQILEKVESLEKRVSKRVRVLMGLLVAAVLLTLIGLALFSLVVILALAGGLLLTFFGSIASFWKMCQEKVRLQHRLDDPMSAFSEVLKRRQHNYEEYVRLTGLYDQYLDWADVLTTVILRTYGPSELPTDAEPYGPDSLLASFSAGSPQRKNEAALGEKQKLRRQLVRREWLNDLLTDLFSLWEREYAVVGGFPVNSVPSPQMDCSLRDENQNLELRAPRIDFHQRVTQDQFARVLRERVEDQMREVFRQSDPTRLLGDISCDVPGLDGREMTEFLVPPLQMTTLPDFQDVLTFDVAGATFKVSDVIYGVSEQVQFVGNADWTQIRIVGMDSRMSLSSFRLDLSENVAVSRFKGIRSQDQTPVSLDDLSEKSEMSGDF